VPLHLITSHRRKNLLLGLVIAIQLCVDVALTWSFVHIQSSAVKRATRILENYCRSTKTTAPLRARGYNFTALEVAHILPISWATHEHTVSPCHSKRWTLLSAPNRKEDLILNIFSHLPNAEQREIERFLRVTGADRIENTMILRSDAHCYFDDYQLSFYQHNVRSLIFRT
jgi:hypothetical protein